MESATKVLISAIVSIITVTVFWPPYSKYNLWDTLSQSIDDTMALFIALLMLVSISVLTGIVLSFDWTFVTLGSVISYILLISFVELNIQADSPVHIVAYAVFILIWLASFVLSNRFISTDGLI